MILKIILIRLQKVYPILSIFINNSIVNSNQTIQLVYDFSNKTIPITCASINSKPDVKLVLYDSITLEVLSNDTNSIIQSSCNNSLCTKILQLNYSFQNLKNLTSLTCTANSTNQEVPLFLITTGKVSVQIPGYLI